MPDSIDVTNLNSTNANFGTQEFHGAVYIIHNHSATQTANIPRNRVFLSYARDDDDPNYDDPTKSLLRRLARDLSVAGLAVWWDRISLPSRSLPFSDEIEKAIQECERFVLVAGPHARQSEWVKAELNYAVGLCKPVTVILRDGDFDSIPEVVEQINAIDFRLSRKYADALEDLLTRLHDSTPIGALRGVKQLPRAHIERLIPYRNTRDAVCSSTVSTALVSGLSHATAVFGQGGIGKSTLAAALAHDCYVRRKFRDGVIWLEVGQTPIAEVLQATVGATAFGDNRENYTSEQDGRVALARILRDKTALIVLDDVWDHRVIDWFPIEDTACRLLVTTRNGNVAARIDGVDVRLGLLTPEEGATLIAKRIGGSPSDPTYRAISEYVGGHTLAVTLAAAQIQYRYADSASDMLRMLMKRDNPFTSLTVSEHDKNENLELSLNLSYSVLTQDIQRRFRALGVFALEGTFDRAALAKIWGDEDEDDARMPLQKLLEVNLLEDAEIATAGNISKRYRQHRLLRMYARALLEQVGEATHVFDAYRDHFIHQAQLKVEREDFHSLFLDAPNLEVIWQHSILHDDVDRLIEVQRAVEPLLQKWSRYVHSRKLVERVISLLEANDRKEDIGSWYLALSSIISDNSNIPLKERVADAIEAIKTCLSYYEYLSSDLRIRAYRKLAQQHYLLRAEDNQDNSALAREYLSKAVSEVSEAEWQTLDSATLFELAEAYNLSYFGNATENKQNALYIGDLLLKKLEKNSQNPSQGDVLQALGDWRRGFSEAENPIENLLEAISALNAAANFFKEKSQMLSYGNVMNSLGLTHSSMAQLTEPVINRQKGIEAYQRALQYRTNESAPFAKASVLSNLGYSFYRLGRLTANIEDLEKGLAAFKEARLIRNPESNPLGYSTLLNNEALIYDALAELRDPQTNFEKAITLLEAALELRNPNKQAPGNFSVTATNLASVYVALGYFTKPEHYAYKAIALTEEVRKYRTPDLNRRSTSPTRGDAYLLLGRTLDRREDIEQAIELYDEALAFHSQRFLGETYFLVTRTKIEAMLALKDSPIQWNAAFNLCKSTLEIKNIPEFPVIYIRYIELLGDCSARVQDDIASVQQWEQARGEYNLRHMALDADRVRIKLAKINGL